MTTNFFDEDFGGEIVDPSDSELGDITYLEERINTLKDRVEKLEASRDSHKRAIDKVIKLLGDMRNRYEPLISKVNDIEVVVKKPTIRTDPLAKRQPRTQTRRAPVSKVQPRSQPKPIINPISKPKIVPKKVSLTSSSGPLDDEPF